LTPILASLAERQQPLILQLPILRREEVTAVSRQWVADPVIASIELTNGTMGYGETVARHYITGESVDSVIEAAREVFVPALMDFHPASFPEALEAIEALPWRDSKQHLIPATRACLELALLDAATRVFRRCMDDVVQWMGLPGFGSPGSLREVRYGGVLASENALSVMRRLRVMYWGGLRAFKLEVGFGGDRERLERVASYLSRPMALGRATLRVDANGQWSKDDAIDWLGNMTHVRLDGVEQPLSREDEDDIPVLHDLFDVPIIFDESLITAEDGRRLIERGVADGFNIRIAKCGGLMPSLRLAALGCRAGVKLQLGCMMGETSILSAAGMRFLEVCPGVVYAEGCNGRRLLRADVVAKPLGFGYGGRPPRTANRGFGSGLEVGIGIGTGVDTGLLERFCEEKPIVLNL
jgi:muconate cycloisomerase